LGDTFAGFFVVLVTFIGAMFFWLPRLSHRELFFAVTVRADFPEGEEGRSILRAYGGRVVLVTLAVAALAIWGVATARLWAPFLALFLQIAGCYWAFLGARKGALRHAVAPSAVREARLEPRKMGVPGGWLVQFAPFLILGAAAAVLDESWQRIPARFPVHWGIDGQANGWSVRTTAGVYGPLLLGAGFVALLILLTWAIVRWTRHLHARGAAAAVELARERRYLLVLVATEYVVALSTAWAALLPLRARPESTPSATVPLGLLAGLLIVMLVLLMLHRPQEPMPAEGEPTVGDGTEDRYWIGGVIYVNPNDPALFVERRFGIGYTLNLGNKLSWLIMAPLLFLALLPLVLGHRSH
jgi:uncharacterized membrane protein